MTCVPIDYWSGPVRESCSMGFLHWLRYYPGAFACFASSPYILLVHFLHWLRDWSNLLVTLATFLYVLLTWRMLRALRHESTREHRLRHLQDIKDQVARPIGSWVDSTLIPALRGGLFLVSPDRVPKQTKDHRTGKPVTVQSYELARCLAPYEIGLSLLFLHTQREHFPGELRLVGKLVSDIKGFLNDYLAFAKACAETTARATVLPRLSSAAAAGGEFADSDFMIALSLQCLLAGKEPGLFEQALPDGTIRLETDAGSQIGRGQRDLIRSWTDKALQSVREEWARLSLGTRVSELLAEAVLVSTMMKKLGLTYDLRGDCDYVGGETPRLAVALRRLLSSRSRRQDTR